MSRSYTTFNWECISFVLVFRPYKYLKRVLCLLFLISNCNQYVKKKKVKKHVWSHLIFVKLLRGKLL